MATCANALHSDQPAGLSCFGIEPLPCDGPMRILLIEDDDMIGRGLIAPFEKIGVAVDWVRTGADAREALRFEEHSLVLLDICLPDTSGLDILRDIRASGGDMPVLLLTARDAVEDRVFGLDLGADDYLAKPFALDELLARVRALTRRRGGSSSPLIEAGALSLALTSQELSFNGETKQLTAREFALMRIFMERPGTILSRAQIEDRLYGWGDEVESNAVEVLIHSVRRKFAKDVIRNVRGAGWMIARTAA